MVTDAERNAFHIGHMLDAIRAPGMILGDGGLNRVLNDRILVLAFERAFEILSEASRRVSDDLKATEPGTAWRQIAGIGNVLRHDYDGDDLSLRYQSAVNDMPGLETALRRMLDRLPK